MKTTGMSGTDAAALEAWTEDVEEKLTTDSSFQTALQALYNEFVSEAAQIKLAQSGIGANAIAALSAAFDGNLYLTDNTVGGKNFAVKSSDDDFVDNLGTKLSRHFASLNGNEITGEKVLAAFIDALNDFSSTDKTNIKTVLDHDKVDLYTPLEAATQRPSSGSSSSGKKNNSSSSSKSDPIRVQIVTYATPEPPAEAAPENLYDDTIDHWGKDYVGALTASGVLTGYGDGTFMPNMGVTREEIAVILTRALGLETAASVAATTNFTDRSYISEWAIDAVNVMVRRGVFEGYDDGSFKPQQVISREEMVAVIIRTFSNEIGRSALTYTDADTVSEWAREYLEKATGLSLVEGYPDGSFRPRQTITRAEAAKVMYNYMHYAGLNK